MSSYIASSHSHLRIARSAKITKPAALHIARRSVICDKVVIRSDLGPSVKIGKCTTVLDGTVITPSSSIISAKEVEEGNSGGEKKVLCFLPVEIGSYTIIGRECVLEGVAIGSCCTIEDGSYLSNRTIVKDCVLVKRGSVVPPDTVIPPFAIVSGCPARIIGFQHESVTVTAKANAEESVEKFSQ
jgi:dynactin-5